MAGTMIEPCQMGRFPGPAIGRQRGLEVWPTPVTIGGFTGGQQKGTRSDQCEQIHGVPARIPPL